MPNCVAMLIEKNASAIGYSRTELNLKRGKRTRREERPVERKASFQRHENATYCCKLSFAPTI